MSKFLLEVLQSLTISSRSPPPLRSRIIARGSWYSLLHGLQSIMPNIQRINFNGANFSSVHRCPLWVWLRLIQITWNGIGISDGVGIRGVTFKLLHNLREMYTDDSFFVGIYSPSIPINSSSRIVARIWNGCRFGMQHICFIIQTLYRHSSNNKNKNTWMEEQQQEPQRQQ